MPIVTYVENGELVGYLPHVGEVRVPVVDVLREARVRLTPAELAEMSEYSGGTIVGGLEACGALNEEIGGKIGRKIAKGLKKAVKAVAKSKIVKGMVKLAAKVTPPPFNMAIKAAQGAAKFAKAVAGKPKSKKGKATKAKAKKLVPAVRAAAAGRISPKALTRKAKKVGIKPSVAAAAATMKRVAMDAQTNPDAAATMALAADLTSTNSADNLRAAEALAASEEQPMQADGGYGAGDEQAELDPMTYGTADAESPPMTEASEEPDVVQDYEQEQEPEPESDPAESYEEMAGYY